MSQAPVTKLPKAAPKPAPVPRVTDFVVPELPEAIDLRKNGDKFEVVALKYLDGISETRVIFTSASGPEAVGEFLKAAKKKCLPLLGIDLGPEASKL